MSLLAGKKILITGVISERSIAYSIAAACRHQGATLAFTYADERFAERVREFASVFGTDLVFPCNVESDEQIEGLFTQLHESWGQMDGLVHAIAFAPREAIAGDFLSGCTRENFRIAHDVSAYSFAAMAKAARPILTAHASLLTLSYLGANRVVPNYNMMGLAKASLEASVLYLAEALGPQGARVNAISAGPIKTLAASGIKGFGKILDAVAQTAPLRRNVSAEQVAQAAVFLLSDLSGGITAEVLHVDSGFNAVMGALL